MVTVADDITVVVTTYNRPAMLRRAVASVQAQTLQPSRIIICDDGSYKDSGWPWEDDEEPLVDWYFFGHKDNPYLSWYDAIYKCKTPFVAILHDDDWYEPAFLERAHALLRKGVGYVFAEALVHFSDGRTEKNCRFEFPNPYLNAEDMGELWLGSDGVLSPSCVLHRREDLLRNLCPGNVPGFRISGVLSGPDHLVALLPLLRYPVIAWTGTDPLVHFDGGEQSTTIRETVRDGGKDLQANYDAARALYRLLRDYKRSIGGAA